MARYRDPLIAPLKQIRRRHSAEMMRACRADRLAQVSRADEAEAIAFYRESLGLATRGARLRGAKSRVNVKIIPLPRLRRWLPLTRTERNRLHAEWKRDEDADRRLARRDPMMAALKRQRRGLSLRLWRAHREGRLPAEMRAVEHEGMAFYRREVKKMDAERRARSARRGVARADVRAHSRSGTRQPSTRER